MNRFGGLVDDAALLLLLVIMVPVAILVAGSPIALVVRLILELVSRR